ncbi:hypothetical protein ACRN9G_12535 [Shewanella frigidimarina]|uniref:hypothetical protein n=1 Tax=Shewanella frigidimarina TaxID=56812 RepID=UPI003D7A24F6
MNQHFRTITAALSGFNLAVLLGAIASSVTGTPISIVLGISSVGLCFSVGSWLIDQFEDDRPGKILFIWSMLIGFICSILSCIILIAVKSPISAGIFAFSVLGVSFMVSRFVKSMKPHVNTTNKSPK